MRAGVFLGERFEEIEALTVVDLLKRADMDVEMVSVSHTHHVRGSHGIEVKADFTFDEVSISTFDIIVLPGGAGYENLEKCGKLMKYVKRFPSEDKYVAAICAAPSILGRAGLLEGKKATCFPGYQDQLKGAEYIFDAEAVIDGKIITGRSAGCAVPFAIAIVKATLGEYAAKKLADNIYYHHYEG